jgi:hypothetical protein
MRFLIGMGCLCLALTAQTPDTPAMNQARSDVERVRQLVDAGALPRTRLVDAELAVADQKDEAILRKTLYGSVTVEDLTEDQTADMISAAKRQLERRQKRLDAAKKLVDQGVAPPSSIYPLLEDLDRGKRTVDLAESRARVFQELAAAARAEEELLASFEKEPDEAAKQLAERFDGVGVFTEGQMKRLVLAYEKEFAKPLPITARGSTAFHRSHGFDHRGRVDVGLHPDQKEGAWLRHFLELERIPYFAFRGSVPGAATAAHIHIGPPSTRLRAAD